MNNIEKLTELIPTGKANAIPMKILAELLDVNERTLRQLVQKAREQGAPICSECEGSNSGYYMPADPQEAESYFKQQHSRIKSARAALNGVTEYLQICAVPEDTQYD